MTPNPPGIYYVGGWETKVDDESRKDRDGFDVPDSAKKDTWFM